MVHLKWYDPSVMREPTSEEATKGILGVGSMKFKKHLTKGTTNEGETFSLSLGFDNKTLYIDMGDKGIRAVDLTPLITEGLNEVMKPL